ncbi:MAG TPA: hypothetical protein VNV65_05185 [Candidatus Solibacter sp.]|jgi:hypothetical protein|nr:hypothetical protein [Candidatus Solibacter sp.]
MNDVPPIDTEMTWTETDAPSMEVDEEPFEIEEPPIETEPLTSDPAETPAPTESERRRISDYLGDVSRLEVLLEAERRQNEELRAEVQYQRRRIEREEEARLQLMQLLDNSQRLLGNAQRHTQHLLGGNESEIFTLAPPPEAAPDDAAEEEEEAPAVASVPPPRARGWRRWFGLD